VVAVGEAGWSAGDVDDMTQTARVTLEYSDYKTLNCVSLEMDIIGHRRHTFSMSKVAWKIDEVVWLKSRIASLVMAPMVTNLPN
jgi:hypothetical protein